MRKTIDELVKFGEELGFESCDKGVLLPLERVDEYEWGVITNQDRHKQLLGPLTYVKTPKGKINTYKRVDCFTPNIIIKTIKLENNEIVIDTIKKQEDARSSYGLIQAFKHKELGSIDAKFIRMAYENIFPKLPKKIKKTFINSKLSELFEKIDELKNLKTLIENEEFLKAENLIIKEIGSYVEENHRFIIKNIEPCLINKLYWFFIKERYDVSRVLDLYSQKKIKPKINEIENEIIQNYYERTILNDRIDNVKELSKILEIIPENRTIDSCFKSICSNDVGKAMQLCEWTNFKPVFDKNLIKRYYELIAKYAINPTINLFLLQEWSEIKIDYRTTQKIYSEFYYRKNTYLIKEVYKKTKIKPRSKRLRKLLKI